MRMQSKRTTEESTDRGVSPVIGVILMVAITVILAAVIAAFVLDIGPGDTDPQAAVDVDGEGTNNVDVTLRSVDQGDGIIVLDDDDDEEIIGDTTVTGNTINVEEDDSDEDEIIVVAYDGEVPDGDIDLQGLEDDSSLDISVVETIEFDG